ncbi:MAG: hypothetical protein LC679_01675 [Intrasporangiaceae bacterium]|nr:hypothetical protein [Intrasporangiaceae bacterium]
MWIIQRHQFGPHEIVVVEEADDDDTSYSVIVDGRAAADQPLGAPPSFEQIVWLYDRWQTRGLSGRGVHALRARAC